MMLSAIVLICSLAVTPDVRDCTRENAMAVAVMPERFSNPVTCAIRSQAYLAETALGVELGNGERVKVICYRADWPERPSTF
jgi:hypothetical protein